MLDIRTSNHSRKTQFHIFIGSGAGGDADAHGAVALPDRAAAPAGAFALDAGELILTHGDQDLVDDNFVEDRETRCGKAFGETARVAAGAIEQLREAVADPGAD